MNYKFKRLRFTLFVVAVIFFYYFILTITEPSPHPPQRDTTVSHSFQFPPEEIILPSGMFSWEIDGITEDQVNERTKQAGDRIPKIIHQSYKNRSLTPDFSKWSSDLKALHPDYLHLLWTDDDNRLLIVKYYPWLLQVYDSFPRNIHRIDFVRMVYLHHYGGVYMDLDMIAIKNMDPLFEGISGKVVLAQVSSDKNFEHNIPNAWMASNSGSQFWLHAISLSLLRTFAYPEYAEVVTGPVMLRDAWISYLKICSDGVIILQNGLIYGIDWRETSYSNTCNPKSMYFDVKSCVDRYFPELYALTVWTHSWE